jgi:hypothetical protein
MSSAKRLRMRVAGVKSAPEAKVRARNRAADEPEETSAFEDRVDYLTICHARKTALKKGEKAVPWTEFKKKLLSE